MPPVLLTPAAPSGGSHIDHACADTTRPGQVVFSRYSATQNLDWQRCSSYLEFNMLPLMPGRQTWWSRMEVALTAGEKVLSWTLGHSMSKSQTWLCREFSPHESSRHSKKKDHLKTSQLGLLSSKGGSLGNLKPDSIHRRIHQQTLFSKTCRTNSVRK